MPTLVGNIKIQIKTKLDALVTAGVLASVQEDDFSVGVLYRDFGKFPVAILSGAAIGNSILTNRDNLRAHTFNILILSKAEDVTSPDQIETLMENVINAFDNDPTLQGTADGSVEPSTSSPEPVSSAGKNYIAFMVTVKANAVKNLTY